MVTSSFSPSTLGKQRFQTVPFSNRSTVESVFETIRCSVDGSRIRNKTVSFSFENGVVWTGPKSQILNPYRCFGDELSGLYLRKHECLHFKSPKWIDHAKSLNEKRAPLKIIHYRNGIIRQYYLAIQLNIEFHQESVTTEYIHNPQKIVIIKNIVLLYIIFETADCEVKCRKHVPC